MSKKTKVEDDPIWKEANYIAEFLYKVLAELPESERWNVQTKLRNAANDLLFYSAEALGDSSPSTSLYDWGNARKNAYGAKAMYRFAARQGMTELDPDLMLRLGKLLVLIEEATDRAKKKATAAENHELDLWRQKYKIWKEISQ